MRERRAIHELTRSAMLGVTLLFAPLVHATHLRGGEITYERIGTNPMVHNYRIHVFTYVKESSGVPDPYIVVNWGDGQGDSLDLFAETPVPFPDSQKREYIGTHIYAGPGSFLITTEIQYRPAAVLNIPGSTGVPLSLQTLLVIAPMIFPDNNSVTLQTLPLQDACLGQPWEYNPAAVDIDGDSLAFHIVTCLGLNGVPIPSYSFPDEIAPGTNNDYSIDELTGTITWDAPQEVGNYNLAFVVSEYRNGQLIGAVLRDMQVTVFPCDNVPPVVQSIDDTCITAGTTLTLSVTADDPDIGQHITLTATGAPFSVDISPATFVEPFPADPVTGLFSWETECAHVRIAPYLAVFRAEDDWEPVHLVDYHTTSITIVAPAPQNPLATPNGSAIDLTWDASICSNAVGYRVYRHNGSVGFTPSNCETGVPAYTGYQLISGSDCVLSNSYQDDDGLIFGQEYCYMVVACFPDGAQSYASVEFCAILDRQVPIITKVSVGMTDVSAGWDTVQWSNAYDLDILQHPGPYQFRVYRGENFINATTLCYTSILWPSIDHPDTSFIDLNIDTRTDPQVYRVELYGDDTLIGESNVASSLFLVPEPNDEQVTLHFEHNTPWVNSSYEVYRFDGLAWVLIGTSTTDAYVDSGLVNGQEYCYYAISTGAYSDTSIVSPLRNWSQQVCSSPVDLTPPCPPVLVIDNDCEEPLNTLTWTNPNNSCADDTYQYNIWYQDSLGGPFVLVATITGAEDTTITHVNGASVSGCYAVTAIDSVGNESAYSNIVCGDNCPEYTLPNVFTPNDDGVNDLFTPFPYRGVKRIDLQVFNRWGQVVFTTNDPEIGWNGTWEETDEPVTNGVYYYTCLVTYARLAGDEFGQLKGYIHVLRGNGGTPH